MNDPDSASAPPPEMVAVVPLDLKQMDTGGPIRPGETQAAIERMHQEEEADYAAGRRVSLKVPTMFQVGG